MRKHKPTKLLTIAFLVGFVAVWECAAQVAVAGRVDNPGQIVSSLFVFLFLRWIQRWQDRDFRKLDERSQSAVKQTVRTGVPSGDPTLDAMAFSRLERTWRQSRGSQMVVPIFGLLFAMLPIIAAIRGGMLWLLCLPFLLVLVPMHNNVTSQRDAGRRLVMLRQLMS